MATFLPLGTGFYTATSPRNTNDVNITDLLTAATTAATAGINTKVYADDAAAATGGVPVGGLYNTGGAVKVRVT